jgi:hypothetical protein
VQPRLKVGKPGDEYEKEADAVADRVMAMNDPGAVQMQPLEEEEEMLQPKVQMQPLEEEEEEIQPKIQMQPEEEEEELLQPKSNGQANSAPPGISKSLSQSAGKGQPLSNSTNRFMSHAFGTDFSRVTVHTDSDAIQMNRQLGARAFTHANDIYFNKGQYRPESQAGKQLLAHELTHVIQQSKGMAGSSTMMGKGMAVNSEPALEREADHFGSKAARGETIPKYRSTGLCWRNNLGPVQAKPGMIQLAKTAYGDFKDESYTTVKNSAGKEIGVDVYIKFKPGKNVDAKLIGMTQSVRSVDKGKPININATVGKRSIPAKDAKRISSPTLSTDEGIHIDQHSAKGYRNPLYATGSVAAGDTKLGQAGTPSPVAKLTQAELNASTVSGKNYKGWGEHGYRYKSGNTWKEKDAELHDTPKQPGRTKNAEQLFETTALAIDGAQTGIYYGSVQWGWRTDARGKFTRLPFKAQSQGTPSSSFLKAAEIWNKGKTAGDKNIPLPVDDVKLISNAAGVNIGLGPIYTHLAKGTRVVVTPGFTRMGESNIRVVDGPYTGETGTVSNSDLADERS